MVIDEKIIYVYDDFSEDSPCLIGKLYVGVIKGGETYSFEYDADWLAKNKMRVSLDPQLQPFTGRQFPTGKNIFGMFSDASPDRWGRVLMNKRERILAGREQRKPRKLHDSDYLLGVYDETRMGGSGSVRVVLTDHAELPQAGIYLGIFDSDRGDGTVQCQCGAHDQPEL